MADANGADGAGIPSKLITVVLNADGTAERLVREMRDEFQLTTANAQHARGTGTPLRRGAAARGRAVEKAIVTVLVPADRADEVFTALYERAGMATQPGSFMYQAALGLTRPFRLPDLPDEA